MENLTVSCRKSRGILAALMVVSLACVAGCEGTLGIGPGIHWYPGWSPPWAVDDAPVKTERIAVICRGNAADAFSNPEIASRLAEAVTQTIAEDWDHAEVVSQSEINAWLDNNAWNGFLEIGEAVDADIVLAIEIENYSILDSTNTTLYRGTADLRVQTIICETGRRTPETILPNIVYPEDMPIQAVRTNSYLFSQEFVEELSDQILQWMVDGPPEDRIASADDAERR
jgi:hypothetical protein